MKLMILSSKAWNYCEAGEEAEEGDEETSDDVEEEKRLTPEQDNDEEPGPVSTRILYPEV